MTKWESLSRQTQDEYLSRARYLIDYNYVSENDIEALAKRIHKKSEGEVR